MKIESYDLMKITFEYYCSKSFSTYIKNPIFIICYDNYTKHIHSGMADPNIVDDVFEKLYVIVKKDEMKNFNQKIYEDKVAELTGKVKEYYVKKRLQTIEGDFEEWKKN